VSGVSPSAPGEQVLSPAAQKHAQGPEGPSPGVQRVAAGGRPQRSSLELCCGANHDRPLIVVVLSHSWGRARRNRTEHAFHPMDRAEDLAEGLHPDGLASAGPGTSSPVDWPSVLSDG
ncbi:Hypothetical protein DHA2_150644, partial [Giardia duodenalis]